MVNTFSLVLIVFLLTNTCISTKENPTDQFFTQDLAVKGYEIKDNNDIRLLSKPGPYQVKSYEQMSLQLSPDDKNIADLYVNTSRIRSPLLIFSHGNKSSKEAHTYQAKIAASWGFHGLVLSLPNQNEWLQNGIRIAKILKLIKSFPEILSKDVVPNKIILVGHSFGGSAVSIAASLSRYVDGLILLDPALYSKKVVKHLKRIKVPVILLGADKSVFKSKRRNYFGKLVQGPFAEVSIREAHHDDAQYPSMREIRNKWVGDPNTDVLRQRTFLYSIILGAYSLTKFSSPNYAISSFANETNRKFFTLDKR